MLAQHVVNQIGIEGHLLAGLLLARRAAIDQPGDDGIETIVGADDGDAGIFQRDDGRPFQGAYIDSIARHVNRGQDAGVARVADLRCQVSEQAAVAAAGSGNGIGALAEGAP